MSGARLLRAQTRREGTNYGGIFARLKFHQKCVCLHGDSLRMLLLLTQIRRRDTLLRMIHAQSVDLILEI
jgi:hypothetical protein